MLPGLTNGHRLSLHLPLVVFEAFLNQVGIQFFKRGHPGQGDQEVAADVAHTVLDTALLVTRPWRTIVALKQVVTAKHHKALLFLAFLANQHFEDGRLQVIVGQALRHTAKVMKGLHVSFKERLLFLGGKGHGEGPPRIAQAHNEQLHCDLNAIHDDLGFAPVHLGVSARIELQWQVHRWPPLLPPPLGNVVPQVRAATPVTVRVDRLVDLTPGVTLFAGHLLTLGQQLVNACFVRPQDRCPTCLFQLVPFWLGRGQRLAHRLARMAQFLRDLPDTLVLNVVSSSDTFFLVHCNHAPPPLSVA